SGTARLGQAASQPGHPSGAAGGAGHGVPGGAGLNSRNWRWKAICPTTQHTPCTGPDMPDHNYFSNLIWQIADLLRGPYRPPQYERVMLPMTVLRRFDCVLAPTKAKV